MFPGRSRSRTLLILPMSLTADVAADDAADRDGQLSEARHPDLQGDTAGSAVAEGHREPVVRT
jgi:hypothetical protein